MAYTTYFGIEHLPKLETASTIAFDTETCQLQPEVGKLRLLQLGSETRETIVVIDVWQLDEEGWSTLDPVFLTTGIATGGLTMLCLTWAGCSSTASIQRAASTARCWPASFSTTAFQT